MNSDPTEMDKDDIEFINLPYTLNNPDNVDNIIPNYRFYKENELQKQNLLISSKENTNTNTNTNGNSNLNTSDFLNNPNYSVASTKYSFDTEINVEKESTDTAANFTANFYLQNVTKISLVSIEFPNVNQSINSTNNQIFWRNAEDYDIGFPVYSATVPFGNYALSDLAALLQTLMSQVPRRGGAANSPLHFFLVDENDSSDLVSFTSLITTNLPNNPISLTAGTAIVVINAPNHGYSVGDSIYIVGNQFVADSAINLMFTTPFTITAVSDVDSFQINLTSVSPVSGSFGGNSAKTGIPSLFQFLVSNFSTSILNNIGFRPEDSGVDIVTPNPLTSIILPILNVTFNDINVFFTCTNHNLIVGDLVYIGNFVSLPTVYIPERNGLFKVTQVIDLNTFAIEYTLGAIYDFSTAYIGPQLMYLTAPNHGFNQIISVTGNGSVVTVETIVPHNLATGSTVVINSSNSVPNVNGVYTVLSTQTEDTFTISFTNAITTEGTMGFLGVNQNFRLYNCDNVGGITADDLNTNLLNVRSVISENVILFTGIVENCIETEIGGGSNVRIASTNQGFAGTLDNSPNGVLYKNVELSGQNYLYMCLPNLVEPNGIRFVGNSNNLKDVFSKIQLRVEPSFIDFDCFVSTPLVFDPPLQSLKSITFQIKDKYNNFAVFNNLNYSFLLEIQYLNLKIKDSS